MVENDPKRLDRVFSALSDSTRRLILARLAESEADVSELAAPFSLSQPAISKHLKVLEEAGLIERRRDAQRRPRKLAPEALTDVVDWVESFRREWRARLDHLDRYLQTMDDEDKPHAAKKSGHRRRPRRY